MHQNIARYPLTLRTNRENYKLRGGLGLMTLAVLSMVALLSVACQSTAGTVTYLQAFIVDREPSVDVEVGNGAVSVQSGRSKRSSYRLNSVIPTMLNTRSHRLVT